MFSKITENVECRSESKCFRQTSPLVQNMVNFNSKKNQITKEKLEKYFKLTESAFEIAKKKIIKGKEHHASEIISMVSNYLSDARHFEKRGDFVNAFAAINYSHGWLDAGVRLDIFNVKDSKLFTIK